MARVLIPTSLQQFAGGADELEATGRTVREVLDDLMEHVSGPEEAPLQRQGRAASLCQRLQGLGGHAHAAGPGYSRRRGRGAQHRAEHRGRREPRRRSRRSCCRSRSRVIDERGRSAAELSNDEILRYSRHLILPEVNLEGQKKLKAAKVLCIGAGGLGSPLAMYLAAAGVGTIGIVDFDVVDYHQPAAPDHPRHQRRGPPEDGVGAGHASRTSTRTSK